jgi:hypothetical protein
MEELLKYCYEKGFKFELHHDYGYPYFSVIIKGISHSHRDPFVILDGLKKWE